MRKPFKTPLGHLLEELGKTQSILQVQGFNPEGENDNHQTNPNSGCTMMHQLAQHVDHSEEMMASIESKVALDTLHSKVDLR